VVGIIMSLENSLIYSPSVYPAGFWTPHYLNFEDAWFAAPDGTKLHGWYIPNPDARRLVVYCHPNGEHVADQANLPEGLMALLDRVA